MLGRLLASTIEARRQGDLVTQLQTALESRILVEQAKGVFMEREGCRPKPPSSGCAARPGPGR